MHADPGTWQRRDVVRCVRWVARTFKVRAPRRHLLPRTGQQLLALDDAAWLQVCEGCSASARIFSAYVAHAHASATGRPPPAPQPEHQAAATSSPYPQPRNDTSLPGRAVGRESRLVAARHSQARGGRAMPRTQAWPMWDMLYISSSAHLSPPLVSEPAASGGGGLRHEVGCLTRPLLSTDYFGSNAPKIVGRGQASLATPAPRC
ncbi:hypothetical protein RR48_03544 [Papilio machaon]|uniref:Uncharacterized protein n=1 Tax=Papilio machaon TaxID=76193 RepID=A0A0N1IFT6_PAPMA|nr:hypothetical protein RR48_03544 [Papilio machaon]